MTQSTLEPYLKTPDEIRLDNEARKLEKRYWNTTSENPNDLLARAEEYLLENGKSDIKHVRDVGILVDLIKNGTVNDRRNPSNKGREKVRLLPMNWNLLRTLALIMRGMK
ncbi:MAG: hypothetical protein M1556_01205 [Candidatus Thermoplasmatota archaeon]|jgi:hypothetical protein|nr:hypothetical protein [Candidatus Thermoplasmatota archaeon]MCL6002252.1 hypothetical protein [Candidatus Thermoplasmatota archaeon]